MKALSVTLILLCSTLAAAQVRISVPDHQYKSGDKIDVVITNIGVSDVTFCVKYGNFGYVEHHVEEAFPSPFAIQERGPQGWGTLFTDYVDSLPPPKAVTLQSGDSQHFPFRVSTHGTVRLVLVYGFGSNEHFCDDRTKMSIAGSRSQDVAID